MTMTDLSSRQLPPLVMTGIACLLITTVLGCQPAEKNAPAAETFATPQAAFDAAKRAFVSDDFATLTQCFTPNGLDEFAGGLRALGGLLQVTSNRQGADEHSAALSTALKMAFDKYLPPNTPEMDLDLNLPEAELHAQVRAAGHVLSDRSAFVVAFFNALAAHGDERPDKKKLQSSQIEGLKLDNDRASATISYGFLDGEPTPVVFRKLDGQWKIDSMGRFGVSP